MNAFRNVIAFPQFMKAQTEYKTGTGRNYQKTLLLHVNIRHWFANEARLRYNYGNHHFAFSNWCLN